MTFEELQKYYQESLNDLKRAVSEVIKERINTNDDIEIRQEESKE